MAGYSNKAVTDKLGVKPGMRMIVMHAPEGYMELLGDLDERTTIATRLTGRFDLIQYFATSSQQLGAVLRNLVDHLEPSGMLWVSWAKQTSPRHTGLTETMVRELVLRSGLVDVKVSAC